MSVVKSFFAALALAGSVSASSCFDQHGKVCKDPRFQKEACTNILGKTAHASEASPRYRFEHARLLPPSSPGQLRPPPPPTLARHDRPARPPRLERGFFPPERLRDAELPYL
jgi:hypothetical protein